ncbi:MAG TPA: hypothetical protein VLT33_02950, partial [Labilithrix sp.]|nr:hypothetical protein [Labilithrix sp.]
PDDALGVERLIELYVRFAIAHRASAMSLEAVGRARPDEAIAYLERRYATAGDRLRPSIDRRLATLRLRSAARRATLLEQEAIGHELATIGDTIRWMQEHIASASNDALRAELDAALSAPEHDAPTLRELCDLRHEDFDAAVIPLGRDPEVDNQLSPRLRIATPDRVEHHERVCAAAPEAPPVLLARRA